MHEFEILAIWFSSVIAGMVLTMLMPRIVSESSSSGVTQEEREGMPAHQELDERVGSMILIGK